MAFKRKTDNEGGDRNLDSQSKRRHGDSESKIPIRGVGNLNVVLTIKEIVSAIKGLVEKVAGEEIHRQLSRSVSGLQICCSHSPTTVHHVGASGAEPLHELRFVNKVASPIFSYSKIKSDSEEKKPLQIELVDAGTGSVVRDGPLSSMSIKLCVLKGDFGSQNWTTDQFDANILPAREGREPLLKGETLIRLQNGVATIPNLELTDNSRWCARSGKFRLGAKVAERSSNEENIKEGISEPFRVKDKRGEAYKKNHPPSLSDHVWRLEKIRRDGDICKNLCSDGIKTVKDLLRLYTTNPSSLKQKFGKSSNNKWEKIIKHAQECDLADEYDYSEYIYSSNQQAGQVRLLLDPIYKLVGVALHGQNYRRPDTLTAAQDKDVVERAKRHAYENLTNLIPIDEAETIKLLSQLDASPNQTSTNAGGDEYDYLSHLQFSPDSSSLLPVYQLPLATPQDSSTTLLQHEPQHHIPNSAMYMSNRGARKSLWYRILDAFKCFI